ncbi:hypothetical protein ONE63_002608 [Megalurothrips usitatus]|uniref:Spaetzle domain-containing protein n=1 Tax=Megalurothrips usitatus TaxID=439358 RepID=A0AAV7X9H2_9NEOP|nr:hypothetical protein ONE63_002608 [Megalurothrips usitatus]
MRRPGRGSQPEPERTFCSPPPPPLPESRLLFSHGVVAVAAPPPGASRFSLFSHHSARAGLTRATPCCVHGSRRRPEGSWDAACVSDPVDGAVAGAGPGDPRRGHQRGALHQALPAALLPHGRQQLPHIERFIDDNKSLMRRMYGEFQMTTEYGPPAREVFETPASTTSTGQPGVPPGGGGQARPAPGPGAGGGALPCGSGRVLRRQDPVDAAVLPQQPVAERNRQVSTGRWAVPPRAAVWRRPGLPTSQADRVQPSAARVDACESKVEIVTPYWASNSAGKIRAIVNTQHFEQAIHQEVCAKPQTKRCTGDCGCEQKYKWHRLLAYDPDNDCKGIFMDWFLFPSCCVCRCNP